MRAFIDAALAPAAGAGAGAALISLAALLRFESRLLAGRSAQTTALFPSPPDGDSV